MKRNPLEYVFLFSLCLISLFDNMILICVMLCVCLDSSFSSWWLSHKTLGLNKGVEFVVLIFCVLDSTIKRGNGLFLSLILFLVVVFEVLLMVLMVDFWVGMMYRIWIL